MSLREWTMTAARHDDTAALAYPSSIASITWRCRFDQAHVIGPPHETLVEPLVDHRPVSRIATLDSRGSDV